MPSSGLQASQSKLRQGWHCPCSPCGHVPLSPHGMTHAPPACCAPGAHAEALKVAEVLEMPSKSTHLIGQICEI